LIAFGMLLVAIIWVAGRATPLAQALGAVSFIIVSMGERGKILRGVATADIRRTRQALCWSQEALAHEAGRRAILAPGHSEIGWKIFLGGLRDLTRLPH